MTETGLDVPFVPTPRPIVRRMLSLAGTKPGDRLVDLGAGDGRIVIAAANEFGAKALGVELHPDRYAIIRNSVPSLKPNLEVLRQNFFKTDLSNADVVTMYLLPSVNEALRKKLERELHSGARVVTHDFSIPDWTPSRVELIQGPLGLHALYLYKI
ncbi:class I SAM-dependent methyltransferase [Candidatus Bathyarchaeota archaeon]|jgi:cyclopropane fatty-acyl-phospholipid synthase-like methyltransferase|nr:class I SAM-dependent methyltransferase [Candidatus Bathyarchaeota archaeon]